MNKLNYWMAKALMTVWPGILIGISNSVCLFINYKNGAGDWVILVNIFGVVFSARMLYDHFRWKRSASKLSKEFDEIMKAVKPEMDALYAKLMEDFNEESYKKFITDGNKVIDQEARRRSRLRVSKSDRL